MNKFIYLGNFMKKAWRFLSLLPLLILRQATLPAQEKAAARGEQIWVSKSLASPQAVGRDKVVATIKEALKLAKAGTTIHIEDGVYEETIVPIAHGTAEAPIRIVAVNPGRAVLDGDRLKDAQGRPVACGIQCGPGQSKVPQFIHVDGIRVTRFHSPLQQYAVTLGTNWVAERITADHNDSGGIGIAGDNSVLRHSVAEHNGEQGIGGSGHAILIQHLVSRFNNTGSLDPIWKGDRHAVKSGDLYYSDPEWEGGGGKFVHVDGFTIEDSLFEGNRGVALWFDEHNKNVVIRNVKSRDNVLLTYVNADNHENTAEAFGIAIEISEGPVLIEKCVFSHNSGGGVGVWESQNVIVKESEFIGDSLTLRNIPRRPLALRDVVASGNAFKPDQSLKSSGILVIDSHSFLQDVLLKIHGNQYENPKQALTIAYYHNNRVDVHSFPVKTIEDLGWDVTQAADARAKRVQSAFQATLGRASFLLDYIEIVQLAREKHLSQAEIVKAIVASSQFRSLRP